MVIRLGLPLPTASSGLPRSKDGPPAPVLALHQVGFAWPAPSPGPPVVSYATGSTLPGVAPADLCERRAPVFGRWPAPATRRTLESLAVCFLLRFPPRHRDRALPGTLPCGARTFLPRVQPAGDHPDLSDRDRSNRYGAMYRPQLSQMKMSTPRLISLRRMAGMPTRQAPQALFSTLASTLVPRRRSWS